MLSLLLRRSCPGTRGVQSRCRLARTTCTLDVGKAAAQKARSSCGDKLIRSDRPIIASRGFHTVCKAIEVRKERLISVFSEAGYQAILDCVPALTRFGNDPCATFCNPRSTRARILPWRERNPLISDHRLQCPIKRRPVHFELLGYLRQGFALSACDTAHYSKLGYVDAGIGKRCVVSTPKYARQLLHRGACARYGARLM